MVSRVAVRIVTYLLPKNVITLTDTSKYFTHNTEESGSWEVEKAENCKLEQSLLTWKEKKFLG
jgi:hypothetical protein